MSEEVSWDAEPCRVWNLRVVRARKAHQCRACKRTIQPGDYYGKHDYLTEDELWTHVRRCGGCEITYRALLDLCDRETHGSFVPRDDLSCGLSYVTEWGKEPPIELQEACFATNEEASEMARRIGKEQ